MRAQQDRRVSRRSHTPGLCSSVEQQPVLVPEPHEHGPTATARSARLPSLSATLGRAATDITDVRLVRGSKLPKNKPLQPCRLGQKLTISDRLHLKPELW